uniref:S100/CaBP-9k-type calcium binding subdomain domain-containing protein n=1 Tax=Gadus morhua TaxID=8049 RepID=A0A8C5FEQ6_GADMO
MAVKYSDLELALNTLVTGFFSETKDGRSTLDTAEFKTLVSNQLPTLAKTVGEEGGLQTVLRQMGVEEGQDITFENFWALVQKQATDQVTAAPDKKMMCGCSIS